MTYDVRHTSVYINGVAMPMAMPQKAFADTMLLIMTIFNSPEMVTRK